MSVLRAFVVAFMVALAGCVSAADPAAVAKGTKVANNQFTGLQEYSGPPSALNGNFLEGLFLLRGRRPVQGSGLQMSTHQIYMDVSANDWLFLDSAYANGQALKFVPIDRSVGSCSRYGCTVREVVGIDITYNELVGYSTTGIAFQLTGKRGNRVVSIPATYFQGYLTQLAQLVPA